MPDQRAGEDGSDVERVVAGKAVDDGVLLVCSCGHETHVVTVRCDDNGVPIPTPLEQAFTCEGCGTPHWFTIETGR